MNNKAVFFDFDKTLVTVDSFHDYLKYISNTEIYYHMFSNSPSLLKSIFTKNWRKNFKNVLWQYLDGVPLYYIKESIENYFNKRLKTILDKDAIETLKLYSDKGYDIYIVSATSNLLIESFTQQIKKQYNINVIPYGSEMENDTNEGLNDSHRIKINHYGAEKSKIIKQILETKNYKESLSYGDSKGDKYMLVPTSGGYVGKDVMGKAYSLIQNIN